VPSAGSENAYKVFLNPEGKRPLVRHSGINGRIILKLILKKSARILIGFIWLGTESSGGL
jgi:hypothetical protein